MCCTRLTENTGRKNDAKNRHLRNVTQLCRAISSQLRRMSTIGKSLLNNNMSSTCPHNMANFSPLRAETGWRIWGTPANFNVFRVLPSLSLNGSQPNFAQCLAVSWAGIPHIHFRGLLPLVEFCPVQNSLYIKSSILLFWQRYCTALQQRASAKPRRGTRNGITEFSRRVPPIFGRAAITLGIGPHSSLWSP